MPAIQVRVQDKVHVWLHKSLSAGKPLSLSTCATACSKALSVQSHVRVNLQHLKFTYQWAYMRKRFIFAWICMLQNTHHGLVLTQEIWKKKAQSCLRLLHSVTLVPHERLPRVVTMFLRDLFQGKSDFVQFRSQTLLVANKMELSCGHHYSRRQNEEALPLSQVTCGHVARTGILHWPVSTRVMTRVSTLWPHFCRVCTWIYFNFFSGTVKLVWLLTVVHGQVHSRRLPVLKEAEREYDSNAHAAFQTLPDSGMFLATMFAWRGYGRIWIILLHANHTIFIPITIWELLWNASIPSINLERSPAHPCFSCCLWQLDQQPESISKHTGLEGR